MRSLFYFIPFASIDNRQMADRADLVRLGLEHALWPQGHRCVPVQSGPDGGGGLLITDNAMRASDCACTFDPAREHWRGGPGRQWFAGTFQDPSQRPGPADLSRPEQYEGQAIRLLDGHEWIVPRCVAVLAERTPSLPDLVDVADDGRTVIHRVHPRFESISRRAFDFWRFYTSAQGAAAPTVQEATELAVDALAVNYRVTLVEALGLLKLVGETERNLILRAMIDADEVEAWAASQQAARMEPAGTAGEKKAGPG